MRCDIAGLGGRHSVPFVVFQCQSFASLIYFQCHIRYKLCVSYCTGIWTGADTRQLCFSQGADTRYTDVSRWSHLG